ncbi:MAG: ABC transporter permease [Clostridiales bacterium]|nr:ABC transporter permease [Clostridiales bacterium]
MFSIIKNICKVLFKRKSFIITTFILPIGIILLFSSMNSSTSYFPIAIINNDKGKLGDVLQDKLQDMDGIEIDNIDENENYKQKLAFHNYEMVLKIDEDFSDKILNGDECPIDFYSISESDYKSILENTIENEIKSLSTIASNVKVNNDNLENIVNEFENNKPELETTDKNKRTNIKDAFGVILYLMVVSAGVICEYTLEDEKLGTKERILMSKVSEKTYFGGQCIIYFLLTCVPAIEYYIICIVNDFDFGFDNSWYLLIILLSSVLLSVVFSMFVGSLIKDKTVYNLSLTAAIVPIFMLSGAFWPFEFMGSALQAIGNFLPIRWIMVAIERLQNNNDILSVMPIVGAVILISLLLFLLSIFFTRNKIVLVKNRE